jgi:hypothetical protein
MKLFIFALLIFAGCTNIPKAPEPVEPVKPVEPVAVSLPWDKPEWSKFLVEQIGKRAVDFDKGDMPKYCPKYKSLSAGDKANVWAVLFVAIAKRESSYNPKASMVESDGSVSQGLFQLTYGNRHCPKSRAQADLNDPKVNIACAINLAADFVARDGVVAAGGYMSQGAPAPKGLARYWSVVRVPDKRSKHHLVEIVGKVSALKICQ